MPTLATIKYVAIAATVGILMMLSAYASWSWRDRMAQKEVERVRQDMEQFLMKERQITAHYQGLADESFSRIMKSLSKIETVTKDVKRDLGDARVKAPEFFDQKNPEVGVEIWEKARSLMR